MHKTAWEERGWKWSASGRACREPRARVKSLSLTTEELLAHAEELLEGASGSILER